jgi:hypothetical protein
MWFFQAETEDALLLSLSDASTLDRPMAATRVARACRSSLKTGDERLLGVLGGYLLGSIRATVALAEVDVWSCYPGAQRNSLPLEVLASFPRTLSGQSAPEPVLVRHRPAVPRHLTGAGRYDPLLQLATLHVNPAYRLQGRFVAVLDDYLTYGVCAASTIALLRAAGASRVACISIGKFGNVTCGYDVSVESNPYQPGVRALCQGRSPLPSRYDWDAQGAFCAFLAEYL